MSLRDRLEQVPGLVLKPGTYPESRSPAPDEVTRGGWWSLHLCAGRYVVEYISGELVGRGKSVDVTVEDANELRASGDDATAIRIINAHGGG